MDSQNSARIVYNATSRRREMGALWAHYKAVSRKNGKTSYTKPLELKSFQQIKKYVYIFSSLFNMIQKSVRTLFILWQHNPSYL